MQFDVLIQAHALHVGAPPLVPDNPDAETVPLFASLVELSGEIAPDSDRHAGVGEAISKTIRLVPPPEPQPVHSVISLSSGSAETRSDSRVAPASVQQAAPNRSDASADVADSPRSPSPRAVASNASTVLGVDLPNAPHTQDSDIRPGAKVSPHGLEQASAEPSLTMPLPPPNEGSQAIRHEGQKTRLPESQGRFSTESLGGTVGHDTLPAARLPDVRNALQNDSRPEIRTAIPPVINDRATTEHPRALGAGVASAWPRDEGSLQRQVTARTVAEFTTPSHASPSSSMTSTGTSERGTTLGHEALRASAFDNSQKAGAAAGSEMQSVHPPNQRMVIASGPESASSPGPSTNGSVSTSGTTPAAHFLHVNGTRPDGPPTQPDRHNTPRLHGELGNTVATYHAERTASVTQTLQPLVAMNNARSPEALLKAEVLGDTLRSSDMPAVSARVEVSRPGASATVVDQPIPRTTDLARAVAMQAAEAFRSPFPGTVEITLVPEELGRLRITASPGEHGLSVVVTVDRPEVLDQLRRQADLLLSDARAAGFGSLSFETSGQSARDWRDAPTEHSEAPELSTPVDAPIPIAAVSDGLDMRL